MMKYISVAIDGPSGAGKSTVARAAAAKLGYVYVDTGAMYRSIGLAVCRRGIAGEDMAGIIATLPEIAIQLTYQDGAQHVLLMSPKPFAHRRFRTTRPRYPRCRKYAGFCWKPSAIWRKTAIS